MNQNLSQAQSETKNKPVMDIETFVKTMFPEFKPAAWQIEYMKKCVDAKPGQAFAVRANRYGMHTTAYILKKYYDQFPAPPKMPKPAPLVIIDEEVPDVEPLRGLHNDGGKLFLALNPHLRDEGWQVVSYPVESFSLSRPGINMPFEYRWPALYKARYYALWFGLVFVWFAFWSGFLIWFPAVLLRMLLNG